ncbi:baseplate J/gp47 family protein [uncultured Vibrio sp.]|uniref:baseplate J/gp47 family protein n=1 Tax=uncultured Vibrio sp. TaxID=114054 RepID=UPI0025D6D010|nr:baseplate J/gp47 family protein [uncultured Vibrio sp.]
MSQRPEVDFVDVLSKEGIPTTEEAITAQLEKDVADAGSNISNDSDMSPFWRWVKSAVVAPVYYLINTVLALHVLPNVYVATASRWGLELKAWELDVTPKAAVKMQGGITLTKGNIDDDVTVEAGSTIQSPPIDGVVYRLFVAEQAVIPAGQLTGVVACIAELEGQAFNLAAGYYSVIPEEISGIVSAENEPNYVTLLGADEEQDDELALRLQNAFTSSGAWHIDDVYRSIITNVAGIRSDNVFFQNMGHVTPGTAYAYVLMEVGETPKTILNNLNTHIMTDGHHGHGDVLTCKAIVDKPVAVKAEVVLVSVIEDDTKADALAEVESRIRAVFRESAAYPGMTRTRPQSRFSLSKLGSEIHTNMAVVNSVRFTVDGQVQEDIISALEQPRLQSLTVEEVAA